MCQIMMWLNRWTGHKTNQYIISNDNQMHFQQCEILVYRYWHANTNQRTNQRVIQYSEAFKHKNANGPC